MGCQFQIPDPSGDQAEITEDQVALPAADDAIGRLVAAFADPEVGMAYGRQLLRPDSGAIGAHARLFNYPAESLTLRPGAVPGAVLRNAIKLAAYRCGRREVRIPRPVKHRISLNRRYWE